MFSSFNYGHSRRHISAFQIKNAKTRGTREKIISKERMNFKFMTN